jgi:hypothetical protein
MPPDPADNTDHAEAAAIERATGDQVRAALRPYLDHLREINPAGYAYLTRSLTAYGCDWLDAFRAPARFGWRGKRWPAPLNAEIARVIADLGDLEAAAYRAHHGLTAPQPTTEPTP